MTTSTIAIESRRGGTAEPRASLYEPVFRDAIARVDRANAVERYRADDGLVVLADFLPRGIVDEMTREAESLKGLVRRTQIPFVRRGGAIGHLAIARRAPALHAFHQSGAMREFFESFTGPSLGHRRADDPHASALYVYSKKGDHVGWHRDDCGCEPEMSFTVILGLVNRTRSRLEFDIFHEVEGRQPRLRSVATDPGTLAFFCGSKAYHRVTPMGAGEERISFSYVYVKDNRHPQGFDAVWQWGINTLLYFGVGGLFDR